MSLQIDEILYLLYPSQVEQGLIKCKEENDGTGVQIYVWNMPIPQPTNQELLALSPSLENQYLSNQIKDKYSTEMQNFIDKAAKSKGYKDGFACAGYFNSTNLQWKAEAEAFVAWRDAIWEYAHQVLDNSTPESYPTLEQFLANAPVIQWP